MSRSTLLYMYSTILNLMTFSNLFQILVSQGVCGTQPCLNGGQCKPLEGDDYECVCHQRFSGVNCEIDKDPCASSPCVNGGLCQNVDDGPGYVCQCPGRLTGPRCQFGRFCSPNPCRSVVQKFVFYSCPDKTKEYCTVRP